MPADSRIYLGLCTFIAGFMPPHWRTLGRHIALNEFRRRKTNHISAEGRGKRGRSIVPENDFVDIIFRTRSRDRYATEIPMSAATDVHDSFIVSLSSVQIYFLG